MCILYSGIGDTLSSLTNDIGGWLTGTSTFNQQCGLTLNDPPTVDNMVRNYATIYNNQQLIYQQQAVQSSLQSSMNSLSFSSLAAGCYAGTLCDNNSPSNCLYSTSSDYQLSSITSSNTNPNAWTLYQLPIQYIVSPLSTPVYLIVEQVNNVVLQDVQAPVDSCGTVSATHSINPGNAYQQWYIANQVGDIYSSYNICNMGTGKCIESTGMSSIMHIINTTIT